MRVWLDDEREIRPGFDVWVKTAHEAIDLLKTGRVTFISLDHDLGEPHCGTGYDVVVAIERLVFEEEIQMPEYALHTANPVGRERMRRALENAKQFADKNTGR